MGSVSHTHNRDARLDQGNVAYAVEPREREFVAHRQAGKPDVLVGQPFQANLGGAIRSPPCEATKGEIKSGFL